MNAISHAFELWKKEKSKSTTLHRRLFMFFSMLIVFVLAAFTIILLAFNVFGNEETLQNYMDTELSHISSDLSEDFGTLSVQGVKLADSIIALSERYFDTNNISAADLMCSREHTEGYLRTQMQTLVNAIDIASCSSVFLVLDQESDEALHSGLFFKKTSVSTTGAVGTRSYCLRGPAKLAREYGIELLGQWRMEYDFEQEDFFSSVMDTARENTKLSLSRLYYWTERVTMKDNSESGLLLVVPLISEDDTVFGCCGFEVSDRLFKVLYTPDNTIYNNSFTAFARSTPDFYHIENGLIAGNSFLTGSRLPESLQPTNEMKNFTVLRSASTAYGSRQTEIKMYPGDSPYAAEVWTASIMMSLDILKQSIEGKQKSWLMIPAVLLVISLGIALIISRRYLQPVTEGLNAIKEKHFEAADNKYLEINDLMEFLAEQEKKRTEPMPEVPSEIAPMFDSFIQSVKTLSPAERNVFELYMQGRTAKEIAELLYLSINTIKTHNKRIFTKLNVSTRKELMVYIDMMRDMNMLNQV